MLSEAQALEKALSVLKRELSPEEYVGFLRAITPRFRDSARELRAATKGLGLDEVFQELERRSARGA